MLAVDQHPAPGSTHREDALERKDRCLRGLVLAAPFMMKTKQPKDKCVAINTEQPDK